MLICLLAFSSIRLATATSLSPCTVILSSALSRFLSPSPLSSFLAVLFLFLSLLASMWRDLPIGVAIGSLLDSITSKEGSGLRFAGVTGCDGVGLLAPCGYHSSPNNSCSNAYCSSNSVGSANAVEESCWASFSSIVSSSSPAATT